MNPTAMSPAPVRAHTARLRILALCLGVVAAVVSLPSSGQGTAEASTAGGAMTTVQRLHDALIEVMRGDDFFRCPSCKAFVVYEGLLEDGAGVPADDGAAPAEG